MEALNWKLHETVKVVLSLILLRNVKLSLLTI